MNETHRKWLNQALETLRTRTYWSPFPESPKSYVPESEQQAKDYLSRLFNSDFTPTCKGELRLGEEISPYLQTGLGIRYTADSAENYIKHANDAKTGWEKASIEDRATVLMQTLDAFSNKFFEIAHATMHTTGQAYLMSFQASGPHAADRALEAIAVGYKELTAVNPHADWIKNMGKFDLTIQKSFSPVPRGINIVIGCSTFPVWNTVPGVYAGLITGNPIIVKPHPKAVLPMAILVAEMRQVFKSSGYSENLIQLAPDTSESPVTTELVLHPETKIIDFTGGSDYGNYIESLPGKTSFTEKAGVNCVIIDSCDDFSKVAGNIAFSACLYSGQMCTAPQNIFIPEEGISTSNGNLSFDDIVENLLEAFKNIALNPKTGSHVLGAIQNDRTIERIQKMVDGNKQVLLSPEKLVHPDFEHARVYSPCIIQLNKEDEEYYTQECFGPIVFFIKTINTADSLNLTKKLSKTKGAITCLVYSNQKKWMDKIESEMNSVFTPVSFNFIGAALVNSHAAFSDFHVTGGNPAGNASFTNSDYITKRFVWVGNRYMK